MSMVMDERSNVFSVLADCILSGGAYKAVVHQRKTDSQGD
jgi:hypothetical protein